MNKNTSWIERMEILDKIDQQHLRVMGPVLPMHLREPEKHFPNYLEVRHKHLFAKMDIPKGHIIVLTDYDNLSHKNWYIKTPLGNFFNHSYDANTEFCSNHDKKIKIVALRKISKGETLTINYQ